MENEKAVLDYGSRTLTIPATRDAQRDRATSPDSERVPVAGMVAKAVEQVHAGKGRNNAGFWLFCQLRDVGYDRAEASLTLRAWVSQANEAMPGKNEYSEQEAEASLRSAYSRAPRRKAWGKAK